MQNVFSKKFLPNWFAGVLNKKANAVTDKLQIPNPKFQLLSRLLALGVWDLFGIWDLGKQSFIPQRLNRVQVGRFVCRIRAKNDSDDRANHQSDHDPIERDNRRKLHEIGGRIAAQNAQDDTDDPTNLA